MGCAAGDPLLAFVVPGTIWGEAAALAVVIAGSDLRPSEYPSAKNSAQIPTRPKNRTNSLPVPRVISVSCEEAIVQLQAIFGARNCSPPSSSAVFAGAAAPFPLPSNFCSPEKKSTGTGKITVVFFSTPISVRVCRYRNCTLTGSVASRSEEHTSELQS